MNNRTGLNKARYTKQASHFARLGSSILDNLIVIGIIVIFSVLALKYGLIQRSMVLQIGYGDIKGCLLPNRTYFFDGFLVGLIGLFYFSPEFFGWTIGKRMFGLRVADVSGQVAKNDKLFLRYLIKLSPNLAATMFCLDPQLSTLIMTLLFNVLLAGSWILVLLPGRQALYDRWTDTAVYKASSFELPSEQKESSGTGTGFTAQEKPPEAVTKLLFK